jgi:hypothetical protein
MTAPSRSRFTLALPRLRSARGIDGGELAVERAGVRGGNGVDRPHGSERAHRGAEQTDAGEEEEGFLFGGSWHAPSVAALP